MVYMGGPVLSLDGKGRITVPTRWRDHLMETVQGQLVITKHTDGCLALYPLPVWAKIQELMLNLSWEHDHWRRFVMGDANEVEVDGAARLLIPPELRVWAGLEKDVKLCGMGAHFELWDTARHQAREALTPAQGRPEPLRNVVVK
jgi:MraZ protein